MKALTLYQPWATLIALGAKQYETRSWKTPYRGLIVIHAGKNTEYIQDYAATIAHCKKNNVPLPPFGAEVRKVLRENFESFTLNDFPLGAAICVAMLTDCIPVSELKHKSEREWLFGNYTPGRYAWKLENIRLFTRPIPCRGAQGLWNYSGPTE